MTSPAPPPTQLALLALTLGNLRDSWMQISMALKDHIADTPSRTRDEVMLQVEQTLVRIQQDARADFE